MILAIDTSAAQCAVTLLGAGVAMAERCAMERGHAEHLFPLIDMVLTRAGVRYGDIDRVAVCTGPGSFTGVRIGVAAARGIALGRGIPVIGISRFEALAAEVGEQAVICLNGRGGSIYFQVFGANGVPVADPKITSDTGLRAAIGPKCIRFAGDAAHLLGKNTALLSDGLPDPLVIARLSEARDDEPLPAPLYMRGADAELPRVGPPVMLD